MKQNKYTDAGLKWDINFAAFLSIQNEFGLDPGSARQIQIRRGEE